MNASTTPDNADKTRWDQLLDALLPVRPLAPFTLQSGVFLSREYNAQSGLAIWKKRYTGDKGNDLSIFNDWEIQLLGYVKKAQGLYRMASVTLEGTPLTGVTEIQTVHAGPDLTDWGTVHLRVRGSSQPRPHAFISPANYLRLAKGILQALENLYEKGIIHCDLNPGNIVLPVDATPISNGESGEGFRLEPLWHKLTLIDLGYSISTKVDPWVTLPLDTDECRNPRMSGHLRNRLNAIERRTREHLAATAPHKTWDEVRLDRSFWEKWKKSPLNTLKTLDWREDLYQLGYLLWVMRGDKDAPLPQRREPLYFWEHRAKIFTGNRQLNALIWGKDEAGGLAERLMAWGSPAQLDIQGDAVAEMPHKQLIAAIDAALEHAERQDADKEFFLYRADHDPDYREARRRAKTAKEQENEAARQRAEQERLQRERAATEERRRRENLAAAKRRERTAKTQKISQAILLATALGYVGYIGWHIPQIWRWIAHSPVFASAAPPLPIPAPTAASIPEPSRKDEAARLETRASAFVEDAEKIFQHSDWWQGRRAANAQELAWLQTTRELAQAGVPLAQYLLAQSRCFGMQEGGGWVELSERSAADCGQQLSAALQQGQRWFAQGKDAGWTFMLTDSVELLRDNVFTRDTLGKAPPPGADTLARTLAPGLAAVAPYHAELAYDLAAIQACRSNPPQQEAARRTLQALIAEHPGTDEAGRAGRDLLELKRLCTP